LIETTTVAPTGSTAVVPTPLRGTSTAFPGTAGFGSSAEGSVVATTRTFDTGPPVGVSYYSKEWSLGREPILDKSQVLRVRMTTSPTINAICWIDLGA
jgi:hypothetical protein